MRIPSILSLALILTCFGRADAQVRAIYDDGASALLRQLQRLQTTASVLHTGAHPDDEDSALVAYHARGEHARTAYLSLTRGSGGQNIIGPELSDLLGIIRTEELLQARRFDGAEQLFTRASDFGFSKRREEGARLWGEEVILADMVAAIRRFRPTVVVSRWNGTRTDGHGHHQFAGYLTPIAFAAAADPAAFPVQFTAGLTPWQASKLYVSERGAGGERILIIDTGEYDPATGRSYFEIGMHGRSQQKTQQMGSLELKGAQLSRLRLLDSGVDAPGNEESVFDGIDTSIRGIARFEAAPTPELDQHLARLEAQLREALGAYRPLAPASLIPALSSALGTARIGLDAASSFDAQRLLREKTGEIETALTLAAGVSVAALADVETLVPGETVHVAVRLFDPELAQVEVIGAQLRAPSGWRAEEVADLELRNEQNFRRRETASAVFGFAVPVPIDAKATQPYWLERPKVGVNYDWSDAGSARNQPFGESLLTAVVSLEIGGASVTLLREVEYRERDRVRGELRRRLDVVPAISVEPATASVIVPAASGQRTYEVRLSLRNNAAAPISGTAGFDVPSGWTLEPASAGFSLDARPATTTLSFRATMPQDIAAGTYRLEGTADVAGREYRQRMRVIAYPHIRTHRVYDPATTTFGIIDVDVAPIRVGYVMGSGDQVPEAIRRLGIEVELLDDAMLTTGDLSQFDTIVVGIRASQARPAFVASNRRLLEFAAEGGTVVVQYQQPDFIAQGLAPFPASMDGNVRVVDETAPVTMLGPDHPVWNFPNRIGQADFDGWIQERNNYNFTSFDESRYVPLTEAHDPDEPASRGGMVYAKIGDGHYVYTAYSWFRQLPAGTPGAYRIFANLLSLAAAE
ncbi:MAG: PIG-L family deacetylase [Gammaproteobacteria bacterium]|nr:PIG-L family deacetylase [Gammaproteobacteria bacterium]